MAVATTRRRTSRAAAEAVKPEERKSAEGTRPAVIPALRFDGGGWCDELGRSYFRGQYRPSTWEEYDALKRYGREVAE